MFIYPYMIGFLIPNGVYLVESSNRNRMTRIIDIMVFFIMTPFNYFLTRGYTNECHYS